MQGIVFTPSAAPVIPMSPALNSFTLPMAQDKPFTGKEAPSADMGRRRRRRR